MHFHFALWGRFWPIFSIFLGFVGIFLGTPANYFTDFRAILTIFDHFWTILGPIFFAFFDRKSLKPPKNKVCGCVEVLGKLFFDPPPRGGGLHT